MPKKNRRRSTIGTIEQRGESTFRIRVMLDSVLYSETVHGTFEDADDRLLDIQTKREKPRRAITFSRYWSAFVAPTFANLAPKTVNEYKRLWKRDIEPLVGNRKVAEVDWRDVQALADSMASTPSKQRHAFALLRKVCNFAVRDGILPRNPCDRSIKLAQPSRRSKVEPSFALVREVAGAAMSTKYAPVVLLLLGCGMRVEEACALDWEDIEQVDIDGARFVAAAISRTAVSINGALVMQERTKTASSARTVLAGEPFASALMSLRASGPLVPSPSGRTSPATISHNWRQWCKRNGVTYIPLGQMRSVYATLACECADSSLVSIAMGHTDGTTRGRNYQQSTLHGMAMVAQLFGESVGSFLG